MSRTRRLPNSPPYREAAGGELSGPGKRKRLRQSDGGTPAQRRAARVERVGSERREEAEKFALVGVHRSVVQHRVHMLHQFWCQLHGDTVPVGESGH